MENYYKQLQLYIDDADYPQILTLCDTILNQDPLQQEAKICKMVALMHLDQLPQANVMLSQQESLLKTDPFAAYAKVYSTYSSQKYKDCLDQTSKYMKCFPEDTRFQILQGQTFYKLKDYEKAAKVFMDVIEKNPQHEDVQDILVNTLNIGILLQSQFILNKILSSIEKNKDQSRELLFNLSLAYSMVKDTKNAFIYLDIFQKDILSEESDISKMNVMQFGDYLLGQIQQDFLHRESLNQNEKIPVYEQFLRDPRMTDSNMKSVLSHNLITFKQNTLQEPNFSESLKILQDLSQHASLLDFQGQEVLFNKLLVLLSRNKSQDASKLFNELSVRFPSLLQENRGKLAQAYLKMNQKHSFDTILTLVPADSEQNLFILVELARLQKNPEKVVEFLVKIMEIQPKYLQNINMIAYLLQHLNNQPLPSLLQKMDKNCSSEVLQLYAEFLFKRQNFEEACPIFETLYQNDTANPQISASYVHCLQKLGKTEKVSLILESQPLPEIIVDHQILSQLEHNLEFSRTVKDSKEEVAKAKKIKKRVRLPKGFDPQNPGPLPDPERWMPKYMRKKYKGLLKKQTRNQGVDVSNKETMQNFKNKASTANQDVTKNQLKKKKKK